MAKYFLKLSMGYKLGFVLYEIFIVILVLILIGSIILVNFIKTQRAIKKITCISNLKQIDEAIDRYAASYKKSHGDRVYFTDIVPSFLRMKTQCPSAGSYFISTIGADPTCSMESKLGHKLP